ncbi:MAG: hypothetical protein KAX88_03200 [Rhodoferax sp.]|nr:hypothetical protein [Rhodoferax sp.]
MTIKINVKVLERTHLALLVTDGHKDAWVPLSQIEDVFEVDDGMLGISITAIVIPKWLAADKGLAQRQQDEDTFDMFGGAV